MEKSNLYLNITSKQFWGTFLDRLGSYSGVTHTAVVNSVEYHSNYVEIDCTNTKSILPLLNLLFQAYEKDRKIILPDGGLAGYRQLKCLWLYMTVLFENEENIELMKSFINHYYPGSLRLFTTRFLKHLNKVVDLEGIVRGSGVQEVEFTQTGMRFTWPIIFGQTTQEILEGQIAGLTFKRDELSGVEILDVSFDFCWAALSGSSWGGNIDALFDSESLPFKHLKDYEFEKLDTEDFSYCREKIEELFAGSRAN